MASDEYMIPRHLRGFLPPEEEARLAKREAEYFKRSADFDALKKDLWPSSSQETP